MFFIPTVPSPVKNMQVTVKMDTIGVSWERGSGNVDQYRLVLLDNEKQDQEIKQEEHLTSYTFSGLTAGHLYNLSVITEAAELESYNFKLVRTGRISQNCWGILMKWLKEANSLEPQLLLGT